MEWLKSVYMWNFVLSAALIGWCGAQVIKTCLYSIYTKRFAIERMWGDGGMPSAHSATVCALTVAAARVTSLSSPVFAVSAIFAFITMHDAMGVRRETGEQAKIINQMLEEWYELSAKEFPFLQDRKLKEMVGHTPIQVISGAALGVLIGLILPIF